jgi:hypothetical protein
MLDDAAAEKAGSTEDGDSAILHGWLRATD